MLCIVMKILIIMMHMYTSLRCLVSLNSSMEEQIPVESTCTQPFVSRNHVGQRSLDWDSKSWRVWVQMCGVTAKDVCNYSTTDF